MKTYKITEEQLKQFVSEALNSDMPSRWAQNLSIAVTKLQSILEEIKEEAK